MCLFLNCVWLCILRKEVMFPSPRLFCCVSSHFFCPFLLLGSIQAIIEWVSVFFLFSTAYFLSFLVRRPSLALCPSVRCSRQRIHWSCDMQAGPMWSWTAINKELAAAAVVAVVGRRRWTETCPPLRIPYPECLITFKVDRNKYRDLNELPAELWSIYMCEKKISTLCIFYNTNGLWFLGIRGSVV